MDDEDSMLETLSDSNGGSIEFGLDVEERERETLTESNEKETTSARESEQTDGSIRHLLNRRHLLHQSIDQPVESSGSHGASSVGSEVSSAGQDPEKLVAMVEMSTSRKGGEGRAGGFEELGKVATGEDGLQKDVRGSNLGELRDQSERVVEE